MREVEVICQFKTDGSIIPIRFKAADEEQQLHIFNIKRYKQVNPTFINGPHVEMRLANVLDFDCIIEFFGREKKVKLSYTINTHSWVYVK